MANCEGCIHAVVCYKYADACIMKSHSCESYRKDEKRPHGEWKVRKAYTDDGYDDGHDLYCSVCGESLMTLCNRSITAEEARKAMKHHIDENKYCFNCGADMREEMQNAVSN